MKTPCDVVTQAIEDDWLDLSPGTCREIATFIMRRLDDAGYMVVAK